MNNEPKTATIESLARRVVGRIWSNLPEERRNPAELKAETLRTMSGAAENFRPGQNPYATLRETYANAGKVWRKTDDEELRRLFTAANTVEDLSLLFGRTPNGIRMHLEKLGLIAPQGAGAA